MSRYTFGCWRPELGVDTCFACEQPAVAVRICRVSIGICKACALRVLPALFADATYPDADAPDAFLREYRRIRTGIEAHERHVRAELPALQRQAIAELGPTAALTLMAEVAPDARGLADLDDVQAAKLNGLYAEMLGRQLVRYGCP